MSNLIYHLQIYCFDEYEFCTSGPIFFDPKQASHSTWDCPMFKAQHSVEIMKLVWGCVHDYLLDIWFLEGRIVGYHLFIHICFCLC